MVAFRHSRIASCVLFVASCCASMMRSRRVGSMQSCRTVSVRSHALTCCRAARVASLSCEASTLSSSFLASSSATSIRACSRINSCSSSLRPTAFSAKLTCEVLPPPPSTPGVAVMRAKTERGVRASRLVGVAGPAGGGVKDGGLSPEGLVEGRVVAGGGEAVSSARGSTEGGRSPDGLGEALPDMGGGVMERPLEGCRSPEGLGVPLPLAAPTTLPLDARPSCPSSSRTCPDLPPTVELVAVLTSSLSTDMTSSRCTTRTSPVPACPSYTMGTLTPSRSAYSCTACAPVIRSLPGPSGSSSVVASSNCACSPVYSVRASSCRICSASTSDSRRPLDTAHAAFAAAAVATTPVAAAPSTPLTSVAMCEVAAKIAAATAHRRALPPCILAWLQAASRAASSWLRTLASCTATSCCSTPKMWASAFSTGRRASTSLRMRSMTELADTRPFSALWMWSRALWVALDSLPMHEAVILLVTVTTSATARAPETSWMFLRAAPNTGLRTTPAHLASTSPVRAASTPFKGVEVSLMAVSRLLTMGRGECSRSSLMSSRDLCSVVNSSSSFDPSSVPKSEGCSASLVRRLTMFSQSFCPSLKSLCSLSDRGVMTESGAPRTGRLASMPPPGFDASILPGPQPPSNLRITDSAIGISGIFSSVPCGISRPGSSAVDSSQASRDIAADGSISDRWQSARWLSWASLGTTPSHLPGSRSPDALGAHRKAATRASLSPALP
mmetsp:Transcript_51723/g.126171  ORF Transcript_51723/g.126171 Transcript_51723/m.126171 type:complete len:729 (-) Transcript_51723:77-2263(-)